MSLPNVARHATQAANQARYASSLTPHTSAVNTVTRRSKKPQHGERIYIFGHHQKNHIVYSLTKVMKNNAALRQLPFNGKKTVPAALRRDLWAPFATITFPPSAASLGLKAFQRLREYRQRHELEWGDEIMKDEKTGYFIAKKKRTRKVCDQKANCVADMATVLAELNLEAQGKSEGQEGAEVATEKTNIPVSVLWRDLKNAEFAETWPENVEHALLPYSYNNRPDVREMTRLRLEFEEAEQARKEEEKASLQEGKQKKDEGESKPKKGLLRW